MAFKRLWNSICGRPNTPQTVSNPDAETPAPVKPVATKTPVVPTAKPSPTPAPKKHSVLSMLGSSNQHGGLLKHINNTKPVSVLEIGVGDGSRTPAVLAAMNALAEGKAIRYAVIDQFEMADGQVTVREFHSRLAGLSTRPTIVPEPIQSGLLSVAHRIGAVDLVLIDESIDLAEIASQQTDWRKVTHTSTAVLQEQAGRWNAIDSLAATRRAA